MFYDDHNFIKSILTHNTYNPSPV